MVATKKWFKARKYGFGWTPQTFEGWLTTLIYVVLVVFVSIIFVDRLYDPLFDPIISVGVYVFLVGVSTIALIVIAYYTGDELKWRWGKKKRS